MQPPSSTPSTPAVQIPVMAVAELQDSLMVVMHDLQRLEGLLSHTMDNLMERFDAAHKELSGASLQTVDELEGVRNKQFFFEFYLALQFGKKFVQ